MAKRSIAGELRIGELDDEELSIVLSSILPLGAQFVANEVEYRTIDDDWALTLRYEDGAVVDALVGPAMTVELEEQLTRRIEADLLGPSVPLVCRWTMFSGRPVEGAWRYRDRFQIVPPPPEAPRPGVLLGQHPFIVDFVFPSSPNFRVRNLRYARQAYELELLLNLLMRQHITAPTNRARHHWVFAPHGAQPPVLFTNEGYFIPHFTYIVEEMPDIAAFADLDEVEPDQYYDPIDGYSDVLTIPNALEALVDAFYLLMAEDRERFLRSCYWIHIAREIWDYSQSLHLTSLINAVECLASAGRDSSDPEGATKLFKTFMRKYAPGKPSATILDKIYGARSKIAHGDRLLHYDKRPSGGALSQGSATDREAVDDAIVLTRGALVNWLWEHGPSRSPDQLLTRSLWKPKPPKPGTKSSVTVVFPDP